MSHRYSRTGTVAAGLAVALLAAGAVAVSANGSAAHQSRASVILSAKAAVAQHAARIGFGTGQSLVTKDVYLDGYGSTVRFDRTYHGLPLVHGDFLVHLDRAGHYQYAEGKRITGLPSSIHPTSTRAAALSAAAKTVGYRVKGQSTTLAVFG